uniref:Uncharacterized protein n=1 Tax=Parascaris equorum TaxID=6256 RepID=A0A914RLN7_PAREQ
MPKVGHSEWARDTDEEDRVELAIRQSGCWDEHIACVECMSEKSDWRKCQTPVNYSDFGLYSSFLSIRRR